MIGLIAMAAAMTLGDLQTICAGDTPLPACKLYVLGVAQGIALEANVAHDTSHLCLPDETSGTELTEVVKRFAKADVERWPEDKSLAASGFIGAALFKQYPCR